LGDSFDLGSLIEEFREEAREQVDRLDHGLLQLDREGELDQDARGHLMRSLHTLKGNAGMLGLGPIRDFVHVVETVLKGPSGEAAAAVEPLFDGATALRRAIDAAGRESEAESFAELNAARHRLEEMESDAAGDGGDVARLPAGAGEAPVWAEERVRVPFAKLDMLLNEVGELLGEARSLSEAAVGGSRAELRAQAESVQRRGEALRDAVMSLRLVSLARILDRFHGLVRRLGREQGKEARLVVEGEGTEVDKSTADALAEPLLHLIRNAVDHGIEPPDTRESAGKPRHGTLRVVASQEGDRVRIEVSDDGVGLDLNAIVSQGRARGLVAEGEEPSPEDAAELIFEAGFSTRTDVSTVSGRGMGLDVVRRSVRALRGELRVEASPSGGTCFIMLLPLTVAVVPSVIFEAMGETLAVPATAVTRTLPLGRVERIGALEVVRDGERLVPLAAPDRLFGWPRAERGSFGLLLHHGRRRAVLAAHRLLDQRDLVVKAMPDYGDRPRAVSGASVLPGGRVILMLDPAELIELSAQRREEEVT
jgi:two-component system, chemotaxis family, sensor kinase CheA